MIAQKIHAKKRDGKTERARNSIGKRVFTREKRGISRKSNVMGAADNRYKQGSNARIFKLRRLIPCAGGGGVTQRNCLGAKGKSSFRGRELPGKRKNRKRG